jgi:hypothetical protein
MRKALVSPGERSRAPDGSLGARIAQVTDAEFPVHAGLLWVDCPDDCVPNDWYYVGGSCLPKPPKPPEEEQ